MFNGSLNLEQKITVRCQSVFLYKVTIQNMALVKIMGRFPSKGCIASLFNHPFPAASTPLVPSISIPAWPPICLAHFGGQLIVQLVRLSNFHVILNFHVQLSEGICQLPFTNLTWQHFWLFLNRTEEQEFTPLQFSKRKTCLSKKIANNQADLKPSMGKMKWETKCKH
jgi:hypothetical protein